MVGVGHDLKFSIESGASTPAPTPAPTSVSGSESRGLGAKVGAGVDPPLPLPLMSPHPCDLHAPHPPGRPISTTCHLSLFFVLLMALHRIFCPCFEVLLSVVLLTSFCFCLLCPQAHAQTQIISPRCSLDFAPLFCSRDRVL